MVLCLRAATGVAAVALMINAAANAAVQPSSPSPRGTPSSDELRQCFEAQKAMAPFSGVILLDRGATQFYGFDGTSDAEGTSRPRRDTQYRLASVQKVLTRVAIGQLVDRGAVDLAAPVGRYVQDLPPELAAVTIDQLVHHRSGVANFRMMDPTAMNALANARRVTDLLPLITSRPLEFTPGSRMEYSNGGYWLLGAVIEAVSGKDYGQYLEEAIYEPLGMTRSSLDAGPDTAVRKTRMVPGQPPLPEPQPVRMRGEPRGNSAGDGVSTAEDMLKLGKALLGNSLISDATKARLFPRVPNEPWRIGQSGGNAGTNTEFAVYPEMGLVAVTLSNYDPPAGLLMNSVLVRAAQGQGCSPTREPPALQGGPPPLGGPRPRPVG